MRRISSSFNTIYLYIILKLGVALNGAFDSFNTIYLYIILKRGYILRHFMIVLIPYIFTSFSNSRTVEAMMIPVLIPYIFTSFSNSRKQRILSFIVLIPYIFTSFSNFDVYFFWIVQF